tara:strand:- start:258 stop:812 length:555 start_codon:yes stop_codon:yes gene_type:complete
MSLKKIKIAILFPTIILLAGCLSTPPVDFTVQDVGMVSNRLDVELISLTVGYAPQSQQRKVRADASIPPLWKESLQDAINRSLVFTDDASKKVNLSVRITEFVVPISLETTTKVSAIYEIVDRSNGDLLFAQEVSSEGVVPLGYSLVGVTRLVESWNRAVRNNISDFIIQLSEANISTPVFTGQ